EIAARLGELRERDRLTIDTRRRTSNLDLAREDQLVIADACEHSADPRAVATLAHHARRHPAARGGEKRVDEHRLTRAGLAGEDREPGTELEAQLRDQSEVLHRELRDVRPAHAMKDLARVR